MRIKLGTWDELRADASPIRFAVFVGEQNVPPDLELDEMDPVSLHAVAYDDAGTPVGTGRLLPDGHLGRMAVLRQARGTGAGTLILQALVDEAQRRGVCEIVLHAQTHAVAFYERLGFAVTGQMFLEAGIEHVTMRRALIAGNAAA
jgi:predicted GNAT family N-acyltransferase